MPGLSEQLTRTELGEVGELFGLAAPILLGMSGETLLQGGIGEMCASEAVHGSSVGLWGRGTVPGQGLPPRQPSTRTWSYTSRCPYLPWRFITY